MILRGLAHVHSTWSYDGCHDLEAIVAHARAARLDFLLMSEHTRTLTDDAMAAFVSQCDVMTDASGVLVVPGIECEATPDFVHILGYGVRRPVRGRRVGGIVSEIHAAGGFPVFAHPLYRDAVRHVAIDDLGARAGWEVWNAKADGPWLPSRHAVRRLMAFHRDGCRLIPMAGADLHRLEADPRLVLEVDCPVRSAEEILRALATRAHRILGRAWTFAAHDPLREPPLTVGRIAATAAGDVRQRAKRLHRWLARRGLRAPASIAGAARRLLK